MLTLLSPAKSLDLESPLATRKHSEPRMLDEAQSLVEVMRTKSVADVAKLMKISDELAALNVQRFVDFEQPFTPKNARPAILTFSGDVYQGLDVANRFDERDFTEAQKTIRILSGLYGVLRPLDLMQAYRLEMGTRLTTDRGSNLYQWWGTRVTELLKADLAESPGADVVVNLASDEYFSVVQPKALGTVISPRFEDTDARGKRSVVSFYAKRARGEMAAWLVQNRVRKVSDLTNFDAAGYRYLPADSTPERPVFVRSFEDRPATQ